MSAVLEGPARTEDLGRELDQFRPALTAYCRHSLGSASEAEDAVQETFVRAWRHYDRFEGRASLKTWLFRIAAHVCVDLQRAPQRRARPIDLGDAGDRPAPPGAIRRPGATVVVPPTPAAEWLTPLAGAGAEQGDPADTAISRDAVRQAFIATLEHLPARQRAVLILCEVLRWKAAEVAELLGTSVAAVTSSLQRARASIAEAAPVPGSGRASRRDEPADPGDRRLLAGYVDAFARSDVDALVALLR
jgi:RNA polymerase sigma-70 factor (ECF subfamily)